MGRNTAPDWVFEKELPKVFRGLVVENIPHKEEACASGVRKLEANYGSFQAEGL